MEVSVCPFCFGFVCFLKNFQLVTQVVLSAHSLTCDALANLICSCVPLRTGAVWVKIAAGGFFILLLSEGHAGTGLISQMSYLKGQMGVTG